MTFGSRKLLLPIVVTVSLMIGLLFLSQHCPNAGFALTPRARALHRLKNRTALPQSADFNPQVSLSELLKPGDDKGRWTTQQAGRIRAYVVDVAYARPEATNCYLPCRRDVHIAVSNQNGAPQNEQVIVEVTPYFREWAQQQGWDWSAPSLKSKLVGHWCDFEGWMYFDLGHEEESENTTPNNPENWRATAWEIHPVTAIYGCE